MAGHSKWANIKHRKQSVDAKRSKEFQKLTNEIQNASKQGTDPKLNASLRLALQRAKAVNMPKAAIDRAIHWNEKQKSNLETFWLAGFFNKKIATLLQIESGKKIFAINILKKIVQKSKLELLPLNSLLHLFRYVLFFKISNITEEQLLILMEEFNPYDANLIDSEAIFYFDDSEKAKKFHHYILENDFQLEENQQTYIPLLSQSGFPDDLIEEWNNLKIKILNETACVQIADDLKK